MLQVLLIDSWTKGLPHFRAFVDRFGRDEARCVLYHYGSLNGDARFASVANVDGLTLRDYSTYTSSKILDVLDREHPNVVVKLTFYYPMDAAHFKACRVLGVPTIYFAHGLLRFSGLLNPAIRRSAVDFARPGILKKKLRKWFFYFRRVVEVERAWERAGFGRSEARQLIAGSLLHTRRYWFTATKPAHRLPDVAAVYSSGDVDTAVGMGFERAQCRVVGFPQLDRAHDTMTDAERARAVRQRLGISSDARCAVYFTTALPTTGVVSRAAYRKYVARLTHLVDACGFQLVVKVHPVEEAETYEVLVPAGARVIQHEVDTFELLGTADLVIGEQTTMVPLAHYVGKRVVYIDFWGVNHLQFGELARGGRIGATNWDELRQALRDPDRWGRVPSAAERERFIGPFDGQSAQRMRQLVLETADHA